jgi:hypothetical protein
MKKVKKAAKKVAKSKSAPKKAPKRALKAAPKAKKPLKLVAKAAKIAAKTLTGKLVKAAKGSKEAAPTTVAGKIKKGQAVVAEILAADKEAEVILTNADGKQYCRVHDCDNEATTEGHCRYHYLALWRRNKVKAKILQGGKLDKYIEDLTAKYPDKYLEMLRKDLSSEKDFNLIVAEMDVEDSGDEAENEEEASRFIEEVRGGISTPDDDDGGF